MATNYNQMLEALPLTQRPWRNSRRHAHAAARKATADKPRPASWSPEDWSAVYKVAAKLKKAQRGKT